MGRPIGRDLSWRHQQSVDGCGWWRGRLWIAWWAGCGYTQTYSGFLRQVSAPRWGWQWLPRQRRTALRVRPGAPRPRGGRGRQVLPRPRLAAPAPYRRAGSAGPLSRGRGSRRTMWVHLRICAWLHQHAERTPRCRRLRGQVVLSEPGTPLRVGPAGCVGRDAGVDSLTAKLVVDRCLAHGSNRKGSARGGVINMVWRGVDGLKICGYICIQAVERLCSPLRCERSPDPAPTLSVMAYPRAVAGRGLRACR